MTLAIKPPTTTDSVSDKDATIEKITAQAIDESDNLSNDDEQEPHLHAKTFLVVFVVCLIYFAWNFALVGTGAASFALHIVSYIR